MSGKKVKTATNQAEKVATVDIGDFDWKSFVAEHTGHGKIIRLLFVGDRAKGHQIAAWKAAVDEIKKTKSTKFYQQVMEKLGDKGGASYAIDTAWIDATDKAAAQELERLEGDLNVARTQLVRENIRLGHAQLGDAYYERGDFHAALRCYVRTRDYCTSPAHVLDMCLSVIKVSVEMGNFAHVINYVSKAEQTDVKDPLITSKLSVSVGLAHLDSRKYRQAARKFLAAKSVLIGNFTNTITAKEIALYGGLCALASFERGEIRAQVLENAEFKHFLDTLPIIKKIIQDFYGSRYGDCLEALGSLEDQMKVDLHLYDHFHSLFKMVRNKAIKQYFTPYLSVDMNKMAAAFNTTVPLLEEELTQLILADILKARIDSFNKILYTRTINQRSVSFEKALTVGTDIATDTTAMILRMHILKNNFMVTDRFRKESKAD